jgi:drug/metabolite transporter (DMT)-like permease
MAFLLTGVCLAGERGYGTVAAVVTAIIWGLSFVAASMALTTLAPLILATLRFIIAAALYSPVIIWEYRKGNKPSMADLKELAVLGFLSISIYFWLQYTGVQYAGAGVSAVLATGFTPVLTGIAGTILLKEKVTASKGAGIALGLTGVILIALPKLLVVGNIDWLFFLGVGCLLGNSICWSMYSTLSRRLMKRIGNPLMVTAYTTLFGLVFLLPLSLTSDWGAVSRLTTAQWGSILYLATLSTCVAYFLWNYTLTKLEAVQATVFLYLEAVATFIGSFILFGQVPALLTIVGGAAILIGAYMTNKSK